MARREILGIVGLLGLMMIKLDCGEGSTRLRLAGGAFGPSQNTFLFQ
jgi:hypothetical protein